VIAGLLVWQFVHEHFAPPSSAPRLGFMQTLGHGLRSRALMPLMVTLLLVQLSSAIVFPILPLYVQQLSSPGDPVRLYAGLAFGNAIGPLLGSTIAASFGYSAVFIATATVLVALGGWMMALVREPTASPTP